VELRIAFAASEKRSIRAEGPLGKRSSAINQEAGKSRIEKKAQTYRKVV
jgi:hypothetical protein